MIIYINGEKTNLFIGARAKHAVIAYSLKEYKFLMDGETRITDKEWKILDPEVELKNESKIWIMDNTDLKRG